MRICIECVWNDTDPPTPHHHPCVYRMFGLSYSNDRMIA